MVRFAAVALAAAAIALPAHAEWEVDYTHTYVYFEVDHLGFSTLIGRFSDLDITFDFDENDPGATRVTAAIGTESVDTGYNPRDQHLRSEDFFASDEYPSMTFETSEVEVTGDDTARLHGALTLIGETNDVSLDVTLNQIGPNPFGGSDIAGFSAVGMIDRTDFDMNFGAPAIGTDVLIRIEFEATRAEG
jgi:polyisoprenoid-binding protein YceI